MQVTVLENGQGPRKAQGRTPESIARREFGKGVELRAEHDPAFDPPTTTYMVVRADKYGTHVLGRIIAPTSRGRGRPTVGARVHVHIPPDLLDDIDAAAAMRGVTRADEIRRRLVSSK